MNREGTGRKEGIQVANFLPELYYFYEKLKSYFFVFNVSKFVSSCVVIIVSGWEGDEIFGSGDKLEVGEAPNYNQAIPAGERLWTRLGQRDGDRERHHPGGQG